MPAGAPLSGDVPVAVNPAAPVPTVARVYFYLAVMVASWAGNWPLMKLALADAPPLIFVLLRLLGTLALLGTGGFLLSTPIFGGSITASVVVSIALIVAGILLSLCAQ